MIDLLNPSIKRLFQVLHLVKDMAILLLVGKIPL
jgi:hypothetical protein